MYSSSPHGADLLPTGGRVLGIQETTAKRVARGAEVRCRHLVSSDLHRSKPGDRREAVAGFSFLKYPFLELPQLGDTTLFRIFCRPEVAMKRVIIVPITEAQQFHGKEILARGIDCCACGRYL
jgi:hypothetical protein